jgi:hypothetical protein
MFASAPPSVTIADPVFQAQTGRMQGDRLVVEVTRVGTPRGTKASGGWLPVAFFKTRAYWRNSGVEVTHFSSPLKIVLASKAGMFELRTLDRSRYRRVPQLGAGRGLRPGQQDAYVRTKGGFRAVTRHLGMWELVKDVQAPRPTPQLRGARKNGSVILTWKPAPDNDRVVRYLISYGAKQRTRVVPATQRHIRTPWGGRLDARRFSVRAVDRSGNVGKPQQLVQVPIALMRGRDLSKAEHFLHARGLRLGKVAYVRSGARLGTVVALTRKGFVQTRTKVGLTVSGGATGKTLASA